MKKIFFILTLLSTFCGFSQTVIQAEYFWDTDPGEGNGISLQAFDGNFNQALETVFNNNATLPSVGNHTIGIRIKGQEGNWSAVFRKTFKVSANNNTNNIVKITAAEYFWDTDPGEGSGNIMLAFDGNFNQALETILSNNVSLPIVGDHTIGIRVKADDGIWGTTFRKVFRIVANTNTNNLVKILTAEFFWDNDPGNGGGTIMLAFDGNFNQALESVVANNASLSSVGDHVIGIRVKADDGNWGTAFRKVFRVSPNNNSNNLVKVTTAEYFWDNDPGEGSGNVMLAFDSNFNQALESVMANNTTIPSVGDHVIGIRIKADDGSWGATYKKVFRLTENNNSNASIKIIQAEYFWNDDPGQGNGTVMLAFDGNFNQALESVIANDSAFPDFGLNILRIRIKADDGNWGIIYSKVVGVNITYDEKVTLVSPINGAINVPTNSSFIWNLITGAGNYEYQCSTDSNFTSLIQTGNVSSTSIPFSGLNTNTTYYWRVRANVSSNVSLWSDTWSFSTDSTLVNQDYEFGDEIKIVPNPATNYITIKPSRIFEDFDYKIYAIDGKKILEGKLNTSKNINIEKLASSIYTIECKTNTGLKLFGKFIKH